MMAIQWSERISGSDQRLCCIIVSRSYIKEIEPEPENVTPSNYVASVMK